VTDFARNYRWQAWRTALEPIPSLIDWYKEHKISGTLLLAGFVIAKGYVLAHGDTTTAQGIVQYAGLTSVVIAAVLSSVPLLAAAMLAISCYQIWWPLSGDRRAGWRKQLIVSIGAFVLCTVVTRWPFTLGAIVLGSGFGLLNRYYLHADPKGHSAAWKRCHRMVNRVAWIVIYTGSVSAAVAILYTVWLPNEIVAFNTKPNGPMVAYILADDPGGRITLLTSGPRQIVSRKDKDVENVTMCRPTPHGGMTILTNAPTAWAWVTSNINWGPLHALHALKPAAPWQPCSIKR
jgi:hypothetical protein